MQMKLFKFDIEILRNIVRWIWPNSTDYISQYLDVELKQFHLHETDQFMIAKTGYTGELGYEIVSTQEDGIRLWDGLIERGVKLYTPLY